MVDVFFSPELESGYVDCLILTVAVTPKTDDEHVDPDEFRKPLIAVPATHFASFSLLMTFLERGVKHVQLVDLRLPTLPAKYNHPLECLKKCMRRTRPTFVHLPAPMLLDRQLVENGTGRRMIWPHIWCQKEGAIESLKQQSSPPPKGTLCFKAHSS